MASNYPTSLDSATQQPSPGATTDLDASGYEHHIVHTNASEALIALETKLGIGASAASGATDVRNPRSAGIPSAPSCRTYP